MKRLKMLDLKKKKLSMVLACHNSSKLYSPPPPAIQPPQREFPLKNVHLLQKKFL